MITEKGREAQGTERLRDRYVQEATTSFGTHSAVIDGLAGLMI
jgi:hypothetical protein